MKPKNDEPLSDAEANLFSTEFRGEGYLAPSMSLIKAHIIKSFPNTFEVARELSRLGQDIYEHSTIFLRERNAHDPICVAIQIMPRALSSFQGCIILAESGMHTEALTLARSIYECGFWIGYIYEAGEEARDALFADTIKNEISVRQLSKNLPFVDASIRAGLEQQIDALLSSAEKYGNKTTQIKTVAERSGFSDRYAEYRQMCGRAAHTSLTSIAQYISFQDDGSYKGHIIGPDQDRVPYALGMSSGAMIMTIEAFRRAVRCCAFDDRFENLMTRYSKTLDAAAKSGLLNP